MNPSHHFQGRVLFWSYCVRCGLILLRNRATEKASRRICPAALDKED